MVIYLHGFASGVTSTKAAFIGKALRQQGLDFRAPDFNLPDFSTLTVTRMLQQTRAIIDAAPDQVTLIGSSLGGFVGVNAAAAWPDRVAKLVLMAPALDFGSPAITRMGETPLEDWKSAGTMNVFHFGYGRFMRVHYELYEDARRYDAMHAHLPMPVLVFQGRHDDVVDPATVERWASSRPNVELHLLNDGHQLTASLPELTRRIAEFVTP